MKIQENFMLVYNETSHIIDANCAKSKFGRFLHACNKIDIMNSSKHYSFLPPTQLILKISIFFLIDEEICYHFAVNSQNFCFFRDSELDF